MPRVPVSFFLRHDRLFSIQRLLRRIAEVLKGSPDPHILVVGHTDNVPVTASRHLFATNWELSTARATAAVRFLCEEGGIDPARIGAAGYGEFRHIADNATEEGRARNRRIELVVMTEDLLGPQIGPAPPSPPPATR